MNLRQTAACTGLAMLLGCGTTPALDDASRPQRLNRPSEVVMDSPEFQPISETHNQQVARLLQRRHTYHVTRYEHASLEPPGDTLAGMYVVRDSTIMYFQMVSWYLAGHEHFHAIHFQNEAAGRIVSELERIVGKGVFLGDDWKEGTTHQAHGLGLPTRYSRRSPTELFAVIGGLATALERDPLIWHLDTGSGRAATTLRNWQIMSGDNAKHLLGVLEDAGFLQEGTDEYIRLRKLEYEALMEGPHSDSLYLDRSSIFLQKYPRTDHRAQIHYARAHVMDEERRRTDDPASRARLTQAMNEEIRAARSAQ